ncbi:hypothetical protein EV361DRAFT_498148 [Lentinula raphanica]|uniref:Uncharacterized protein n=1 Tax=Lentinula raphanica TaxID=153919 RepID=A0AA38PGZ6_9AGAR|nr:hypothetical protein F5878DRAFT_638605 [Lentinula raphanica]KAJ3975455.1 hypothetical protein EV361DRAFT_498148 [Lentinula raphanica]
MLVTSLLRYLLPFSLLVGALTMAAPMNSKNEKLNAPASWSALNGRFLKTKVGNLIRVSVQEQKLEAESAMQKLITVVLPELVQKSNDKLPSVGFVGWEGEVNVREDSDGQRSQRALVALPAMLYWGCEAANTHKILVQWSKAYDKDDRVSGVLTLADGRCFQVKHNKIVHVPQSLPTIDEARSSAENLV